ncbi:MAG: hypothetical protein HC923_10615 [Myxococcales bacterium]|nr:hypothetical protein [Myxococcales bacterium]
MDPEMGRIEALAARAATEPVEIQARLDALDRDRLSAPGVDEDGAIEADSPDFEPRTPGLDAIARALRTTIGLDSVEGDDDADEAGGDEDDEMGAGDFDDDPFLDDDDDDEEEAPAPTPTYNDDLGTRTLDDLEDEPPFEDDEEEDDDDEDEDDEDDEEDDDDDEAEEVARAARKAPKRAVIVPAEDEESELTPGIDEEIARPRPVGSYGEEDDDEDEGLGGLEGPSNDDW